MSFFTLPWMLTGLLAVPLLLGIYLFRRRFKRREVSALFLWEPPKLRTGGGRKISKLESTLLLFLEILMIALLAAAAAAPGCRRQINIHHAVFVLDSSASMSARANPGSPSPRETAEKEIISYLTLNSPFSCSLIATGMEPKLLLSSSDNMKDVAETLKSWKAERPAHDFTPAFRLARQVSVEKGNIVFMTDSPPPPSGNGHNEIPEGIAWKAFGTPQENTAIVSASRKRDFVAGKEMVFLMVRHFGSSPRDVTLACKDGSRNISEQKLRFMPASGGESESELQKQISIELPEMTDEAIYVGISQGDALKEDDSVILLPEEHVPLRIKISCGSKPLQKILESVFSAMGREVVVSEERPHLAVADSPSDAMECKTKYPDAWILEIIGSKGKDIKENELKINYGPYVVAKRHPVCEGMLLEGIRWASSPDGIKVDGSMPLVSCSDLVLLAENPSLPGDRRRCFTMDFAPERSNLQKTPAWPIMMHDLVRAAKKSLPGFSGANFKAGETAYGRFLDAERISASKIGPDLAHSAQPVEPAVLSQNRNELSKTLACSFNSPVPGLYEFTVRSGRNEEKERLSFNFISPEESDLTGAGKGSWGRKSGFATVAGPAWRDEAWIFLLLASGLAFIHVYLVRRKEA